MTNIYKINERYYFKYLKKPAKIGNDELRIGYIFDKKEKKPVLILDVIRNFLKDYHRTMCCSEVLERSNNKAILVLVDPMIFHLDFVYSRYGYTLLMHELGHYLNGDIKAENSNHEQRRKESLKNGVVLKEELLADEFAIRECGLNNFLKAIEYLEKIRTKILKDSTYDKAMFEFKARKEHAIDFNKSLENTTN